MATLLGGLLSCVVLTLLPSVVDAIVRSESNNGAPASELFPFAVSLQLIERAGEHFCGGTHLGSGWILTAAHCVNRFNHTQIVAQIGGLNLNNSAIERYAIVEMHVLRTYNPVTMVGDIALLRAAVGENNDTARALPRGRCGPDHAAKPLLLPAATDGTTVNGELCYIFGYGSESYDGPVSDTLRYGTVLAFGLDSCIGMMGAVVAPPPDSGMFCAIGQADACKGDSGGGYVCRKSASSQFVLRGIISYGVGCGAPGTPGVYTDVAYYLHRYAMGHLISA